MSSSSMITLFAEPRPLVQDPYSIAFSVLLHGVVIGLVTAGFMLLPKVAPPPIAQHYDVRLIRFDLPDPPKQPAQHSKDYPRPSPDEKNPLPDMKPPEPAMQAPAMPELQKAKVHQTLVQPDAPPDVVLPKDVPLPSVMLWNAHDEAKTIVPPKIQQVTASRVTPSLAKPNKAETLADQSISPTAFTTSKLPMLPTSTSPLAVKGPDVQQPSQIQMTASKSSDQSSQARLMALSDLVMPQGTTALPRVNQVASGAPSVRLAQGQGQSTDSSHGHSKDNPHGKSGDSSHDYSAGFGTGSQISTKHITPPKDGKFTMVLVGNSVEEQYPETAGMWSNRLAYTVYLHVNQPKAWIMQYSLPADAQAAATGGSAHLDAPWPTDMTVPNFGADDINSDAVVVHGFMKDDGHFDKLSVVFPPQFAQTAFLLKTLQEWKFRPASQAGQATAIEVLLIIPEVAN